MTVFFLLKEYEFCSNKGSSVVRTKHELLLCNMSPWRNRLARSAVNRKVGGSSPPHECFYNTSPALAGFLREGWILQSFLFFPLGHE